jgi:hypothetical protein
MISAIVTFITEWAKNRPVTDLLLVMMLGMFAADRYYETTYREPARASRAAEAHKVMREVIQDHDALAERNADRIVSVLTGVKQEQKKTTAAVNSIPEAAAVAAKVIVEQKEAKPAEPPGL